MNEIKFWLYNNTSKFAQSKLFLCRIGIDHLSIYSEQDELVSKIKFEEISDITLKPPLLIWASRFWIELSNDLNQGKIKLEPIHPLNPKVRRHVNYKETILLFRLLKKRKGGGDLPIEPNPYLRNKPATMTLDNADLLLHPFAFFDKYLRKTERLGILWLALFFLGLAGVIYLILTL